MAFTPNVPEATSLTAHNPYRRHRSGAIPLTTRNSQPTQSIQKPASRTNRNSNHLFNSHFTFAHRTPNYSTKVIGQLIQHSNLGRSDNLCHTQSHPIINSTPTDCERTVLCFFLSRRYSETISQTRELVLSCSRSLRY